MCEMDEMDWVGGVRAMVLGIHGVYGRTRLTGGVLLAFVLELYLSSYVLEGYWHVLGINLLFGVFCFSSGPRVGLQ